ncbi:hypothetical protein ACNKHS_23070 [Shigella flexneri]
METQKATPCRVCQPVWPPRRVALGMGQEVARRFVKGRTARLSEEPEPPEGFRDLFDKLPQFEQVLNMPTKHLRSAPCRQRVLEGDVVI